MCILHLLLSIPTSHISSVQESQVPSGYHTKQHSSIVYPAYPSKYLSQPEFLLCLHLLSCYFPTKLFKNKNSAYFVQCSILRWLGALHSSRSINFWANEWTSFSFNILRQWASHSATPQKTQNHLFNNPPISCLLSCSITVLKRELSWLYINHSFKVLFYNV